MVRSLQAIGRHGLSYGLARSSRVAVLGSGAFIAVLATLFGPTGMAAATNPYSSGQSGYDISYAQCGSAAPAGTFGIVGANGGRPFSYNSCLQAEYMAALASQVAPSVYLNTGYAGAYGKDITAGCSASSRSIAGSTAQRKAWAIGCSEAETSLAYAGQHGAASPAVWWLDVETANSWSTSDRSLNRYAIQGATSRLGQVGLVGVYSTASMWSRITGGGFSPTGLAADWDVSAGGGSCAAPFTSPTDPVWLVQSTTSGFDSDLAC